MINRELLHPASIVIAGGSNDISRPGGKVLYNIISNNYEGKLYVVNPGREYVQGLRTCSSCAELPPVDLAIIAVRAAEVLPIVSVLAYEKKCKAFIILSAGFSETGEEGRLLEKKITDIVKDTGATLIGPNCTGIITEKYKGIFAGPVPPYSSSGCDCVSASGATMVYLLEMAIQRGLKFRDIFTVGNSAHIGVEDILEFWDENFDERTSSRIKLLYLEHIADPDKFLKHARSLINKGCRIAAIKAGNTSAGSRAVSSHTGALTGSDSAVSALFRKAGVLRCYSRIELVYVAAIFTITPLKNNRIAVITHAGGPGVMLADILEKGGMQVPKLEGPKADALLAKLHPGSTISNPIDFLATGTAKQLGDILDAVENDFDEIDGAVVVFGTTGMWSVDDVYQLLHEKIKSCSKPIFPILPSPMQAAEEVNRFLQMGHVNFMDEVSFGYVLGRVFKLHAPYPDAVLPAVDRQKIRSIIDKNHEGYLSPSETFELLQAANINVCKQDVARTLHQAIEISDEIGFPLVMKAAGPVHKSDVGGVITGIKSKEAIMEAFMNLIKIPGAEEVILQQQVSGVEVFIGAKSETGFGHQVICGAGGIFIEVFKDVSAGLHPVSEEEAYGMIRHLKAYPLIRGVRGKPGVNEAAFAQAITKISALIEAAPEITEMDINPLMGTPSSLTAVDARIYIVPAKKTMLLQHKPVLEHQD